MLQITCAFRCNGIWPRSASHWPTPGSLWPAAETVKEVHYEGFDLLSKDMVSPFQAAAAAQAAAQVAAAAGSAPGTAGQPNSAAQHAAAAAKQQAQNSMEGDAWAISMHNAEDHLLRHLNRRKIFAIVKTLRDRHLSFAGSPISNYIIKTLVLYECEKHVSDAEWHEFCLGDRVIGA